MKTRRKKINKKRDNKSKAYKSILATLSIEGYEYTLNQKNALYDYLNRDITYKNMEAIINERT